MRSANFGLGQSHAYTRRDQFAREIEFIAQRLVGGANLPIGELFS
jgi:hypothetical protein